MKGVIFFNAEKRGEWSLNHPKGLVFKRSNDIQIELDLKEPWEQGRTKNKLNQIETVLAIFKHGQSLRLRSCNSS